MSYDFDQVRKIRMTEGNKVARIMLTREMDRYARDFLSRHPRLADLLGYYLLLVPAVFLIHYWLKNKNPYWMGIFTFSGLAYIFAGSKSKIYIC
jgi:hypothetical protein